MQNNQNHNNENKDQKTPNMSHQTQDGALPGQEKNVELFQKKNTQNVSDIEKVQKQCEEYLAGWKRAQADYQNLMKEVVKQKAVMHKFAGEQVIQDFLPLVDYFKYAFAHEIPEAYKNSPWMEGITNIQSYLMKILADHGIEAIKTVGEKLNPEFHEAIEEVAAEKIPSGTIVEEVSAGFLQHGKVIKHARVKIAK